MIDTEFAVGEPVVYTPYPGAAEERGVVTSLGRRPSDVFVRYATQPPDAAGKLTPVDRLRADPRPPLKVVEE